PPWAVCESRILLGDRLEGQPRFLVAEGVQQRDRAGELSGYLRFAGVGKMHGSELIGITVRVRMLFLGAGGRSQQKNESQRSERSLHRQPPFGRRARSYRIH